ncbi:MAG: class I SAM-dependent methyltransferase [Capsulimonadaceae bacterium]
MRETFNDVLEFVRTKSPLQAKAVNKYVERQDERFWAHAEHLTSAFLTYLHGEGMTVEDWVDAYVTLCNDTMVEQARFARSGKYASESLSGAYDAVYSNSREMTAILLGLALSQILWENHYRIFTYFQEQVSRRTPGRYLEIGAGHGLFVVEALKIPGIKDVVVVDISETAITMSKKVLECLTVNEQVEFPYRDIKFLTENILDTTLPKQGFDFITMGEVIEHVENPDDLLAGLKELLAPNGVAFITTCCNCPSKEHVYLLKSLDCIHDLLDRVGLKIESELVLHNGMSWTVNGEKLDGINYAALVS